MQQEDSQSQQKVLRSLKRLRVPGCATRTATPGSHTNAPRFDGDDYETAPTSRGAGRGDCRFEIEDRRAGVRIGDAGANARLASGDEQNSINVRTPERS